MKLLRLKITDPRGFRSLQSGFEHHFRSAWSLQEELASKDGFSPFVCAGRNGSGKSNLLEVLAAIFFQLEILRVRRSFLPEVLQNSDEDFSPVAFELDYLIQVPPEYIRPEGPAWAKVGAWKKPGESVRFLWENQSDFDTDAYEIFKDGHADILLPQYVLGYSSGENEILSLPFFKMRFVQFDEYWQALKQQLPYPGRPESRLVYLDSGFSQAILLCNLLLQNDDALEPFRKDVGIDELKEFRILIRRSTEIDESQIAAFGSQDASRHESIEDIVNNHPALSITETAMGTEGYRLNLVELLEGDEGSDKIITRLKRCATCWFEDDATDTLVLDYYVNEATKQAFRENFDFKTDHSPIPLFQAFQVLLTLNLYAVSDTLKAELYTSDSHYVNETVPTLASDQRVMRFKFVKFSKKDVAQPMMLKELSDGEHQLLHSLGLCLLFKNTNSLFLLDEPETHFNPDWRSNFITRLRQCLAADDDAATTQEMLITTHTPFLISDSKPEQVLVFKKEDDIVSITPPDYNTLGASINKITMNTFDKRETIGGHAQGILDELRKQFENGGDKKKIIEELNQKLGDSLEKILLIKSILDSEKAQG